MIQLWTIRDNKTSRKCSRLELIARPSGLEQSEWALHKLDAIDYEDDDDDGDDVDDDDDDDDDGNDDDDR